MSRTFYDIPTGRIIARSFSGHGGPRADDSIGSVAGFYDPETMWLPSGVPTARAAINYSIDKPTIVAAGGEFATVTNLPAGCMIHHDTSEYSSIAGGFTFDASTPGEFLFTVDEPSFLKTTIKITAT